VKTESLTIWQTYTKVDKTPGNCCSSTMMQNSASDSCLSHPRKSITRALF